MRDARRENRNVGDVRSVKTEVDNQRLSDARLIHGAIMVVAWLFLSPWASLLARMVAISILGGFERIERAVRGDRFDRVQRVHHHDGARVGKPWGPHGKYGLLVIALGFAQGYMGLSQDASASTSSVGIERSASPRPCSRSATASSAPG